MSSPHPSFTSSNAAHLFQLFESLDQVDELDAFRLTLIQAFKQQLKCTWLEFSLRWTLQGKVQESCFNDGQQQIFYASLSSAGAVASSGCQIHDSAVIPFPGVAPTQLQLSDENLGWEFSLRCSHPGAVESVGIQNLLPFLGVRIGQAIARLATPVEENSLKVLLTRELQILYWVAMGKSNEVIGMILKISHATVKNHVHRIYQKLDVGNRAYAVNLAIKEGIFGMGIDSEG